MLIGKLNLVDLAGSERVVKTEATGDRLKEAQNINKSLSSLGDVIHALGNKKPSHVPYRNSKLTFLLQDSLGGSSKVAMFVTVSPALYNVTESICSLNFASRCRNVELGMAKKQTSTSNTPEIDVSSGLKTLQSSSEVANSSTTDQSSSSNKSSSRSQILRKANASTSSSSANSISKSSSTSAISAKK